MIWLIGITGYVTFTVFIMSIMKAASKDDDRFNRDELAWISQLNNKQEVKVG
ncbi:hypothetical protein [Niallia taxi]|uniref:hypothetical protein n=1 Tax=Niallia taxi TaxID=2499688 RepID=UPI0030097309